MTVNVLEMAELEEAGHSPELTNAATFNGGYMRVFFSIDAESSLCSNEPEYSVTLVLSDPESRYQPAQLAVPLCEVEDVVYEIDLERSA